MGNRPQQPRIPLQKYQTYSLAGAGIGLVAFIAFALLPSLYFGGFTGILVAAGIHGSPASSSYGTDAFVAVGMLLGVAAGALTFAALGAAAGAAGGALTVTVGERKARETAGSRPVVPAERT